MILSGLTMNFMLYENDYGLAIARLYCRFSPQRNVVKSSLKTFPKVIEGLGKLFSLHLIFAHILSSKCVVYSNYDVLLVCVHAKDHGDHRVFKIYIYKDCFWFFHSNVERT